MSLIDEIKEIFADLSEEDRLKAAYDSLEAGIEAGIVVPVRDPDGSIRYIHTEHYDNEPKVSLAEVRAVHQERLYGKPLS